MIEQKHEGGVDRPVRHTDTLRYVGNAVAAIGLISMALAGVFYLAIMPKNASSATPGMVAAGSAAGLWFLAGGFAAVVGLLIAIQGAVLEGKLKGPHR